MIEKTYSSGSQFWPAVVMVDTAGNPVTSSNPLQTASPDVTGNATITTRNLNGSTGEATAGSSLTLTNLNDTSTITIQTVGTYTGALTVQVSMDGNAWVSLGSTALINVNTGAYSATIPSAAQAIYQVDSAGFTNLRIVAQAAVTGSVAVYARSTQAAGMLALDNPLPTGANQIGAVSLNAASGTGGTNPLHYVSTASTNATNVKNSAGRVYSVSAISTVASASYVKLFNTASAPVLGTDTPVKTFKVPASGSLQWNMSLGTSFSNGISYAITTGASDTDATATAAGDVILDIDWL